MGPRSSKGSLSIRRSSRTMSLSLGLPTSTGFTPCFSRASRSSDGFLSKHPRLEIAHRSVSRNEEAQRIGPLNSRTGGSGR